jgi:hypothetical protein
MNGNEKDLTLLAHMRREKLKEDLPQIFQSCTFNRSATSPVRNINYLVSLPYSVNGQRVQNVSIELFGTEFLSVSLTYHSKIIVAKSKSYLLEQCTIEDRVAKLKYAN